MNNVTRPVFIAGPARSGTTLLLTILLKARDLWGPYREMHGLYEWHTGLSPDFTQASNGTSGRNDNVLTERHATADRRQALRRALWKTSFNVELFGASPPVGPAYHVLRYASFAWKRVRSGPIRILDKNPKHCFRTAFLKSIFPNAQFVFLYRRPEPNISSLIEGWKSGSYATYRVPRSGNDSFQWHFDLPPEWRAWMDCDLPERCARQWVGYNRALLDAENALPDADVVRCRYEDVIDRPLDVAQSVLGALDVSVSKTVRAHCRNLPVVNAVSSPNPEKWRKREDEIRAVAPLFRDTAREVGCEPVV